MDSREIQADIQKRLSERRYRHSLGVVKAAEALATFYKVDVQKAKLAALIHDAAKEMPLSTMHDILETHTISVPEEVYHNGALLHGLVGSILGKEVYGITDEDVLEAVAVHTTGKVGMSTLDQVIFLADYIEENRDFPGVDTLRDLAFKDKERAMLAAYDNTILFLLKQGQSIYAETILARNDIIKTMKNVR